MTALSKEERDHLAASIMPPEPCLKGYCRSPIACNGWGYCRERNMVEADDVFSRRVNWDSRARREDAQED